jgi:hypothetical protein
MQDRRESCVRIFAKLVRGPIPRVQKAITLGLIPSVQFVFLGICFAEKQFNSNEKHFRSNELFRSNDLSVKQLFGKQPFDHMTFWSKDISLQ